MSIGFRFGRRLRLPSKLEIKTELRAMMALDAGLARHVATNALPAATGWDELGAHLAATERATAKARALL